MITLSAMQPHYLPWLGYFELIRLSDKFVFLDDVQTTNSKSYFNRTKLSFNGITKWSTVPLEHSTAKGPLNLVQTSSNDWLEVQLNRLQEWYREAPGLEKAVETIVSVPTTRFLSNFNISLNHKLLDNLHIDTAIYIGSELKIRSKSTDRLIELCKKLNADHYLTGHGAFNYLDHLRFEEHGIDVSYINYNWNCSGLSNSVEGPYLSIFDYLSRNFNDMNARTRSSIVPWREFNQEMVGFQPNVARN